MPESELTRDLTKVIKKADKLVRDLKQNTKELIKAAKEVKELLNGTKNEEEKGE